MAAPNDQRDEHESRSHQEARDVAIEALGGTPPHTERPPVSPLRLVVPPSVARRVAQFDLRVDTWFERLRGNHAADRVFYGASALGDFSLIWLLAGTANALRPGHDSRRLLRLFAMLGAESLLINVGVKSLFRRTRPEWHVHPVRRLRRPRSSSFPSGHATSGFLAASILSEEAGRAWPLWYGLAAVVAASRVHVKIHHASDVLAGVGVGILLGRIARGIAPVDGE